jgi:hypothetical protein
VPVTLTGSGSDPDGTIALYEWDFEDDGINDYTSSITGNTTHLYAAGNWRARFTVRDDDGGYAVAITDFTVDPVDSIYVSDATGSIGGDGTQGNPLKNIAQGILIANSQFPCKGVVILANGTYNATPSFQAGISIYGGFDPVTWTHTPGNYSIINCGVNPVTANSIGIETVISGIEIHASNAATPGANSIALSVVGSTADLRFIDCGFFAANGATGQVGTAGTAGTNGGNGLTGANGTSGGSSGGGGGAGGTPGFPGGAPGSAGGLGGYASNGSAGTASACGLAGAPGTVSPVCFTVAGVGGAGNTGCTGTNGANGVAGTGGRPPAASGSRARESPERTAPPAAAAAAAAVAAA